MLITDVRAFALRAPLPRRMGGAFRNKGGLIARQTLLIRVETDTGLVGWGESFAQPAVGGVILAEVLRPMLCRQDPLDPALWDRLYFGLGYGGHRGVMVETLSGVDIALWDLRGKQEERSVSHLLADALGIAPSAIRTQIPCYATGLFYEPLPELLAEARSYVDQGFRAIKMKIGLGLEEDLARVRAVREAIGPDIVLKVDANCAYDLAGARRMDERLREFDIDWFEEPLRVEDLEGYVALSDANQIRIATGEGAYLRWGFAELLPFIDVAQPDVIRAGGLSELVHIMRQARDAGVSVSPHAWAGAVCLAASIHLSAVAPTFETFEYDRTPNPLREQLTREPFRCENGVLDVPTSPGLGIDLDSEAVVRYVVAVT